MEHSVSDYTFGVALPPMDPHAHKVCLTDPRLRFEKDISRKDEIITYM